jgi:Secretion system C-terminal sorting domain
MNKSYKRFIITAICSFFALSQCFAQATLEWTLDGSDRITSGPSTAPITVTFLKDALNANINTVYSNYTPTLTSTISFRNQQRSSILTGSSVLLPGLTFGGKASGSDTGVPGVQVANSVKLYSLFGSSLPIQLPKNSMFMASPTAIPAPQTNSQGEPIGANSIGTGLDVRGSTGATGPAGFISEDANFGVSLFSSVDPLFKANEDKEGRFYYGDIVVTFNRPVKNPVVHIGGLGGSYSYVPLSGGARQVSYFSTELELQNTGMTSTLMAGNELINVVGNHILNGSATPNGGSFDDGTSNFGIPNYGAASGSVRVNGTVQELVYRVYVRGSAASDFNFAQAQASIVDAIRSPLIGDNWYFAVSLDKPSQEISGNVFVDVDGQMDSDINKTNGVKNSTTNIAEQLFALLLNPLGRVVASTAVSADGRYLFSNVPLLVSGNYSVQLGTIDILFASYASSVTAPITNPLPLGWVSTGEFVSDVTTIGNDGIINGKIEITTLSSEDIKVENNFGIERIPESVDFINTIQNPTIGTIVTLVPTYINPNGSANPLPILTGSDPEDLPLTAPLTNKAVKITTLPSNAQMLYENVPVTINQVISNYDPSLLQIKYLVAQPVAGSTEFKYAFVDAAGIQDPTPATYTLSWAPTTPLPVTLESFTATKNSCVATLNWKTATEVNTNKFEIEMSTQPNNMYAKVGSIAAKGNSTTIESYTFSYPMQTGVVYYFRLKIINLDGTYAYSSIQTISCMDKQEITFYPNPTKDIVKIAGMEKGKNIVSILCNDGRVIKYITTNNANAELTLAGLPNGMYILKMQNENGSVQVKRIVKN